MKCDCRKCRGACVEDKGTECVVICRDGSKHTISIARIDDDCEDYNSATSLEDYNSATSLEEITDTLSKYAESIGENINQELFVYASIQQMFADVMEGKTWYGVWDEYREQMEKVKTLEDAEKEDCDVAVNLIYANGKFIGE